MRARLLSWIGLGFVLLFTYGCSRSADTPLDGTYLLPDGRSVSFGNGLFVAVATIGNGQYEVSGNVVTLRLSNGTHLQGERLGSDELRFIQRDGKPVSPLILVRAGSPSAHELEQRTAATHQAHTIGAQDAQHAESQRQDKAIEESRFTPDPSVALNHYTVLSSAIDYQWMIDAFRVDPLSDEELLSSFALGYAAEKDTFKRRDLAKRELPALRSRLVSMRAQHYYAMPFGIQRVRTPGALNIDAPILGPYDLQTHEFPLGLSSDPCWGNLPDLIATAGARRCALPVADEVQARRIEAERSKLSTPIYTKGTVYICITQDGTATSRPHAQVMRTQVALASFTDPQFTYEGTF